MQQSGDSGELESQHRPKKATGASKSREADEQEEKNLEDIFDDDEEDEDEEEEEEEEVCICSLCPERRSMSF